MLKAYKYRLYPNKQQIEQIQKTFGCCRFVRNYSTIICKEKFGRNLKKLDSQSHWL